jgi:hypothetical protein
MTTAFAIYTSTQTITAPSDAVPGTIDAYLWGPGGNGGTSAHGSRSGAGGGGAAMAGEAPYAGVTPGSTSLVLTLPAGGAATAATITGGTVTIQANPGTNASGGTQGTGGAAGSNTIAKAGGNGAVGINGATTNGAGGGGSGGSTGAGGNASTSTGGTAGTGGTDGGQSLAGAAGASGAGTSSPGANGTTPGSGASGGGSVGALNLAGGTGGGSQALLVWTVLVESLVIPSVMTYIMATARQAASGFQFYSSFTFAPLPVGVINQWEATFAQPAAFGNMPPALQSTVVELTPATSTGIGSGVPSEGNWLFLVAGLNEQSAAAGHTIAGTDDIHSFWRPGDPSTSTWAVSPKAGKTRTSIWYTANLSRQPGDAYAAPSGALAGMAVTVLEVSGLGPWDTVTAIDAAYAAASTSLGLALGAPSAPAFVLAAACGDDSTAGQALAPGSPWQTLTTVTAGNGTDHTCDAVLTTAYLSTTSGSVSISATASSAANLSGVIIGVLADAPAPFASSGLNPAWPQRTIMECALGAGFETPPDECTWTVMSDSAWTSFADGYKRYWGMGDNSGVPYALGQLQSSTGVLTCDNADGALSPSNSASPFYPGLQPGTPVRLRMALGTMAGTAYNRWYILQRNAAGFPEQRNKALRNFVPMGTTDIWSVVAGSPPSPYRAEVLQDLQAAMAAYGIAGWWWPCDDQPLSGGVLPTSLRNAAPGNSTALQIIASPGGVGSQDAYSTSGTDLTSQVATYGNVVPPPGVASYSVAQQAGFLYGDPQSSPATATAGGPVTASPGSACWQQTGLLGNAGSATWFLAANDTYPDLAATGVSVSGWCNYGFFGSATGVQMGSAFNVAAQPDCPLTLWELCTGTAPQAILQLDTSGHLALITYNGGSGTSHSVYTSSDLRCAAFWTFDVLLTSSTWRVMVNGGLTADASGSATVSPTAPTWFTGNGDLGSGGGSTLSGIQHGANVALSGLAIIPGILPAWRIRSRYAAAITGYGVLPAPTGLALSAVGNQTAAGGAVPDGSEFQGSYGFVSSTVVDAYTFSAVAAAVAGSYTSGPSARAVAAGIGQSSISPHIGYAVWAAWNSVSPLVQLYTSAQAGGETEAGAALAGGDSYTDGYGSGASGHGAGRVSSGTGASPPTGPSVLGDTIGQRIERILGNARIRSPMRAIDRETLQVHAALDTGGTAVGSSIQNQVNSGSGLLYVGTDGYLRYRSKDHLFSDGVVWYIGMDVANGYIPFASDIQWENDNTKVYDVIQIQPYSPDQATLPLITPTDATAVDAVQDQMGPKPLNFTSYLQDQSKAQSQANWLFTQFGTQRRRVQQITVDAATHPAAWPLVIAANCGEIAQILDSPFGQPTTIGTYRISRMSRTFAFGANGQPTTGELKLVLDPVPTTVWS